MMRWISIVILAGVAGAAAAQPLMPAPPAEAPPAPIARMYALYAHGAVPEQPHIDEEAKSLAPVLKKLPFTSYEAISILEQEVPWAEPTLFPINALYAMQVTPYPSEEDGFVQIHARVEMLQDDGQYVNALDTRAYAADREALLFRGMPLHRGELVIVLIVAMPSDNGQDGAPQEDDSEQPEDEQEQEQEQSEEPEDSDDDDSASEEERDDTADTREEEASETEEEPADDLESLEALLESLEDIDRQEQKEELKQRDRIDFKGDWW